MLSYDSIRIHGNRRNFRRDDQADRAYEQQVMDLLMRIFCTHVGAAIRAHLRRDRTLYIRPERRHRSGGQVTTHPGATPHPVYRDAYLRGEQVRWPSDNPRTPLRDETGRISHEQWGGIGTGRGSSSIIRIDVDRLPRPNIASPADEVLVHEMVHALRHQHGVLDNSSTGFHFEVFEEFAAITVTNMYRSELGRVHRADHARGALRGRVREYITVPPVPGSQARIEFERSAVARLHRQMPGFTTRLQLIPASVCDHNPFVEYMYNPVSTRLPVAVPRSALMTAGSQPTLCLSPPGDPEMDDDLEVDGRS